MLTGVDEAGRGPVMGPLVVAAVSFDDPLELKAIGVADSKLLARSRRDILAERISDMASTTFTVVPASAIDEARKLMTMNRLEVIVFSVTISSHLTGRTVLHPDVPGIEVNQLEPLSSYPSSIYLDAADVKEERFGKEVLECCKRMIDISIPQVISRHRADSDHSIVGAASIVAKSERDSIMDSISRSLGVEIGSGYPSDERTIEFIREYVRSNGELPPHCRKSWETGRRILREDQQSTLTRFG